MIDESIPPETDSGTMALLGYDPLLYYKGRGSLEALGLGFLDPGQNGVGFRINFASFDEASGRLDRRTARDLEPVEQEALVEELRAGIDLGEPDVELSLIGFGRHRGILCLRSPSLPLSAQVSNTDPGFRMVGPFGVPNDTYDPVPQECVATRDGRGAANTARLVNRIADQAARILDASPVNRERRARGALPANRLLFRDAGERVPDLQSFRRKTGLTLALYGQVPAEHGLCKLVGGRYISSRQPDGQDDVEYYRNLLARVLADPADVIVVHLKSPDEPGHDHRPVDKMRAIESLDRHFVAALEKDLRPDDLCIVTSDHCTPCDLGIHSADPVPTAVRGGGVVADDTQGFSEAEARRGSLQVKRAADLLDHLLGKAWR